MSVPRPGSGFRPDIEGLRGVAVLLVVLGHLTGRPRGGFIGVDVFFVISGFLITGLLVSERERSGGLSLRHFYLRRARRLLPAGLLVLVATDVAAALLLLPSRAHAAVVDSVWSLFFLANTHFAALGTDYFSLTRAPSPVEHYWSLSVEEQFYLVWPCVVLVVLATAARRPGRGPLVAVAAAVVALSLAWSVISTARTPASAYFSSPARAWELGAGALLLLLAPRRVPAVVGWFGAAGLLLSVLVITPATAVPGYALLLPVLSTVGVLAAGGQGALGRWVLGNRPLRYVGKISYSLYLWHWPVIVLGATLPGGTTALGKTALLTAAVLLSVASYHLVEQPFRRPRRRTEPAGRIAWAAAPAYAATLVVALVATWLVTMPERAAPRRLPPGTAVLSAAEDLPADIRAGLARTTWPDGLDAGLVDAGAPEWLHDKCLDVSAKNAERCTYGPPTAARSVAVLGDSVAVSWLPALRRAPSLADARIHVLTRRQCANLRGAVSPHCTQHQDWMLSQVRLLRPDLVILSARYAGGVGPDEWRDATVRMLAELSPYALRIVVLAPPPESGNLQSCYTRLSSPADCTLPVSDRWRSYAAAEQQAAGSRARFLDPRPWFCADGRCPAVVDDGPVMFDGRHLTAAYAARIAPALSAALS